MTEEEALSQLLALPFRLCTLCNGSKTNGYVSVSGKKEFPTCYRCKGKGVVSKKEE